MDDPVRVSWRRLRSELVANTAPWEHSARPAIRAHAEALYALFGERDAAEARGYQHAIDHVRNAFEHGYLRYIQDQANAGHYTQWLNQNELTEVANFLTARKDRT
jgi:hypothetical protein